MPAESYITYHRPRLQSRHYITDARVGTMWFNFYQAKLRDFVREHGSDFCLVINGSSKQDDAFILPYKAVKDFFSPEMLDGSHRWVGSIRMVDEVILISANGKSKEFSGHEFHNAFQLLKDAPMPLPNSRGVDEFV
jgi:hypothetical protein